MLIILDRDGVINFDSVEYIKSPEEWIPIPGSLAAIARLNKAKHTVVIATNQSGVARGLYSLDTLMKIHQKMQAELNKLGGHIDAIYFCPHHPQEQCDCRKPQPGLMKQILKDFNVEPSQTLVIGDSWRDLQAASAVNCPFLLVLTGNGQQTYNEHQDQLTNIKVFPDLSAAVDDITIV